MRVKKLYTYKRPPSRSEATAPCDRALTECLTIVGAYRQGSHTIDNTKKYVPAGFCTICTVEKVRTDRASYPLRSRKSVYRQGLAHFASKKSVHRQGFAPFASKKSAYR